MRVAGLVAISVASLFAPNLWGAAGGVARAAVDDRIELELRGPAVPYAAVHYVIEDRADALVLSVTKTFAAEFGHRSAVGLLPRKDLEGVVADLHALGAHRLPTRTSQRPRARYTLTMTVAGARRTLTFDDPEALPAAYQGLVDRIHRVFAEATEPIVFEDALLLPSEYGRLRVATTPVGTVRIDGVAVAGHTPHSGLRLTAGGHRVAVTPLGGGPPFEYDVQIRVGRTTSLVVDLK